MWLGSVYKMWLGQVGVRVNRVGVYGGRKGAIVGKSRVKEGPVEMWLGQMGVLVNRVGWMRVGRE